MTSGDRLFSEHFFFSKKIVQLIWGLHPDHSQNDQLFLLCAIIFFTIPLLAHQIYQLSSSELTLQSTVGVLQKTMGAISLLTGYSTTYFNFATIKQLVTDINNSCKPVSSEVDLPILEEYIKQSKSYAYFLLGALNGYVISIAAPCVVKLCLYFLGILDENKLSLLLPVNSVNKAGVQYFGLFIYQTIAVTIIVTVGGVGFSAYMLCVLHASYKFHVLILKIRRPFKRNLKYMGKDCYFSTPQEELEWIVDIINKYKKATEYVHLLNNFSQTTYLFTVTFAMTLVIFDFLYIFQLSICLKNAVEIVECSFYIAITIFGLYLNFYLGQELMSYSDAVFKELCQIPFYILSKKSQKSLLFMLTRSCKPCILSIGGMFVSSHDSFASLIRKAFSFAMVYYNYV